MNVICFLSLAWEKTKDYLAQKRFKTIATVCPPRWLPYMYCTSQFLIKYVLFFAAFMDRTVKTDSKERERTHCLGHRRSESNLRSQKGALPIPQLIHRAHIIRTIIIKKTINQLINYKNLFKICMSVTAELNQCCSRDFKT